MSSQAASLRALPLAELQKQVAGKRQELMNLRFQLATRKLSNYTLLRSVRREVARLLTVIAEAERNK